MSIGDSLLMSALGMIVVFAVLCLLILVIVITSAVVGRKKKEEVSTKTDLTGKRDVSGIPQPANGSFGSIKTYDVPDVTVAMIMAIVADQLETPLNQLRFISIKEVK